MIQGLGGTYWTPSEPVKNEWKKDYGPKVCVVDSQIASGNYTNLMGLLHQLRQIDGYWTIAESSCQHLGCTDNAGVYWCNVSYHTPNQPI